MSKNKIKPHVYELKKDNFFISKISTNTTEEYTNIAFLRAKTRLTPLEYKKTYKEEILKIKSTFENFTNNLIKNNSLYDDKFLFSITIAEDSVKYHKTTHLHYDLFVKTKQQYTLLEHKDMLTCLSDKLDDKLILLFKKYSLKWY